MSSPTAETIGFIGLGLMGHGMAKNIVEKGYRLTVVGRRNRKPIEDLVSRGAHEVLSAAELARRLRLDTACVFGRIENDRLCLDVLTLSEDQLPAVAAALGRLAL